MEIVYKEINTELLEKIHNKYGKWAKEHIHLENGSFSITALHENIPIGFISTYTKKLPKPLDDKKDAYIDVIEIDEQFRRKGIAKEFIKRSEKWAKDEGLSQIRSWSSQNKIEAISMWYALDYNMCPAKIWVEWCKEIVDGYYVVKKIN